jgi:hypothetical protein
MLGLTVRIMKPRGIRNNNPGNIRKGSSPWTGKIPHSKNTDKAFEQFKEMRYGVRAMAKLIHNYVFKYDVKDLHGIISKYAPSSENNVEAYVQSVAKNSKINPHDNAANWYNNIDDVSRLLDAMILHENGKRVEMSTIKEGVELAKLF